jgi:hypothetical protein
LEGYHIDEVLDEVLVDADELACEYSAGVDVGGVGFEGFVVA